MRILVAIPLAVACTWPVAVAHADPVQVARCASAQLTPSLGPPDGAAGTTYYPVILQNAGGAACSMSGYPAVSFIAGSDNHLVGVAASQDSDSIGVVVIDPGQSTAANLGIVNAGNFPADCAAVPVSGLQVNLPGDADPIIIGHADTACASTAYNTLRVGPFTGA
ncbi:DUF4232 domain-containing protein [Mycolicibacterium sp. CBMA 234]|uniref:DUF4232 domain-containing protein n=1 Tax=Mycolicibacterium sp. CBMA 234 TaxID=1918495 RepID=UPI0012DCC967|nr:DUF4232 domain-containing protein [Mycolicibacterium sp. CBMA 234]